MLIFVESVNALCRTRGELVTISSNAIEFILSLADKSARALKSTRDIKIATFLCTKIAIVKR